MVVMWIACLCGGGNRLRVRIAIHYHIEAEDDEVENVEHHHRTHLGHAPAWFGGDVDLVGGEKLELLSD